MLTKFYDFLDFFISFWSDRFILAKWRKQIIPSLRGEILEIGVGCGKNLIYYSSQAEIIATDISSNRITQAIKKLKKLNRNNITLQQANVEKLLFADNTFDYVLATCVFCSVNDPVKGLQEVKRTLKKNGQAIFIEHIRSQNYLRGKIQDFLTPLTVKMFGCRINRPTINYFMQAGLKIIEDKKINKNGIWRLLRCSKN